MSVSKILIGDTVTVCFYGGESIVGVVAYKPQDVGDSWTIIGDDGTITNVMLYESMTVMNRKALP